jgi:hypothetical protein
VRRADHSSRGVLPTVVCLKCVIVKPRRNEEAQALIGLSSPKRRKNLDGVGGQLHWKDNNKMNHKEIE